MVLRGLICFLIVFLYQSISFSGEIRTFPNKKAFRCKAILKGRALRVRHVPAQVISFSDKRTKRDLELQQSVPQFIPQRKFLKLPDFDRNHVYVYQSERGSKEPQFDGKDKGRWIHFSIAQLFPRKDKVFILKLKDKGLKELKPLELHKYPGKNYTTMEIGRELELLFAILEVAGSLEQYLEGATLAHPNLKYSILGEDVKMQSIALVSQWSPRILALNVLKSNLLDILYRPRFDFWNIKQRSELFDMAFTFLQSLYKEQGLDPEPLYDLSLKWTDLF